MRAMKMSSTKKRGVLTYGDEFAIRFLSRD